MLLQILEKTAITIVNTCKQSLTDIMPQALHRYKLKLEDFWRVG